ncbi:CotS family spore coat protein [Clostridium sp. MB40-C1]|uniref:CotS family spore coat protein n=1 Tax=Clostridium sp. MB40-C1 TaxID=3070996 RepID=UPI0027E1AF75|nr:CotS family spore coat protein [Clostridium sp. MB40-C1]WMJ79716.1 CotS family spore coat protein [Clostridium sp. MB40-C1]
MNADEVKRLVENEYNLDVDFIEKIKNVYKISSGNNQFCLKVIRYDFGHFLFIISAMKHLRENGFENILELIKTNDNCEYVKLGENYAYLTEWLNARVSNYDNPLDTRLATLKLAELHKKSRGFNVTKYMNPRIGWLTWIQTYKTRKNEILDFKNRIYKKEKRSKFDEVYLSIMEEELERADRSIENLIKSNYIYEMKEEMKNKGFCHHDYANHNVLIDNNNNVNVIDFDYCILDTYMHDLSSLLIRRMKYGKWTRENATEIIETYNAINCVKVNHIPVIKAFMEFPQDYWQRGIQYYWEKKNWGEEFFLNKLQKYIEDREEKQEFITLFKWRG